MDIDTLHFIKGDFKPSKKVPQFLLSDPLWNKSYLDALGEEYLDETELHIKSNIRIVEDFYCNFTIGFFGFIPQINEVLGHKGWIRFENDVYQRKFIELMSRVEYIEFINDPFKFINEKAIPRLYRYVDHKSIVNAYQLYSKKINSYINAQNTLHNKHHIANKYLTIIPTPLDVFGDYLRGTKNLLLDLHNCPDLVKEAALLLVDLLYEKAVIARKANQNNWLIMPLHIPSILSVNDFTTFFFPSFKLLIDKLLSEDFIILILLEGKVERLLDKIFDIASPNVIFNFEEDIPCIVKEKMNSTNTVSGFYPIHLLKYGSDIESLAYAQKLLNIFEKNNYIFSTDKVIYSPNDVDIHKLKLVYKYVHDFRYS
ncbi:hypothetical protein GC105_10275 [Alkalibaculum sp. M08DMB]|uniref:Uroporphyrinogen decarboxylase (URO-D) domain-containing protein n=1 Tax=Alkalibaculum sporogenes TaxID=2655001 RepID=A0A6A7K9Y6_9FIRM|nr:hypothetical protein [Alkalibaculum sporogenes]MPW26175.1 hypothetical protein [Alkalibaculum sporogenes]